MKQKTFTRQLWLLLAMLLAVPLGAWADRDVNQLQFGKQVIEVADDEVITFYDFKGAEDIPSSSSSNSQSMTVFTPATAGKSVQITFEEIDIIPDMTSGSYPAFMKVYSGTPDDTNFTWATKTSEVTKNPTLPDGNVLVTRGGTVNSEAYTSTTPETYISEAADGSMAVGFIYVYAKKCKGWKATVRAVTLSNMTVTGAGSNYDGVVALPVSKQNNALANAYVTAEGMLNPDHVTAISFTMTKNESAMDPTALKLFKGDTQVEATISAEGTGYKFTLDEALADGTSTFTIKGDFLGTAATGAKVEVAVTKVATTAQPDGIAPFTAGTSVAVENPALVLMSSEPQTITVGETPLMFLDEGGADGTIKGTASGQVTFVPDPAITDKKVMVDFSSIDLNNGDIYYQVLKIYNGTEPIAANLIAEKRHGESGIVRSTSDDGALTIVLEAAQQTYDYDGWEATVSLFTPQPMDFDTVTATAASTETVCAGDANQDMLSVNVKAVNTEPAMQVTKMAFSTEGSNALVTKAALYFGSTKVGEVSNPDNAFVIELTSPQALVEGNNNFTLKYDISDEAINDNVVKAKLTSVTAVVNETEKTESVEAAAVERTVNNIVLSHANQGTVTKTVNGSLSFKTKTTSEYSTYCEPGTDDRINIFVPKHEGMVAQIDFSSFEVQYSSSSYGTKSTFKIYAGQGTSGTLLWELNDNSQQNTGPETVIRSTAADGSLTIVFNPKASSYYYYNGFDATVSEYQSKDMAYSDMVVEQASTADASVGAEAQELLNVNILTEGNLNPVAMSAMKLNLKGTDANISSVSVWQGDNKLGEAASATGDITVTFTEAVNLVEGNNNFVVKADISGNAVEETTIDAKVISVTVAGEEKVPTNGDPEGARTLKNMLLMTEGDHGTFNMNLGQVTTLYDDGGPEGDGADGVNATITFAPTGDADCIKLTDLGINFASNAHLYIYKGAEVNDENLIVDLSGSLAKFDPIITDKDIQGGKITIKYVGKGSYIKPNFAIKVEGYKKTPVVITGVTTEDISGSDVMKGQTDVKMLKVVVSAKGELGGVDVTAFDLQSVDNSILSATHIYQTGTVTTFSANEEFNGSYTISLTGDYYFWVTADVKTNAAIGVDADLYLNGITAGGQTFTVEDPAVAVVTTTSGKSGTYTVGEGCTYATIQTAIDDMASGMDGPVTLKIKAGNYNEKVRIPYIPGMGSVNTLTLESESGERDVKIYHDQYTSGGYSADQHKKDYGVVTLYQASYVTLKNLEITTTDKAYKAVVMVKDESRHATIDNCYLHAPICTTTGEDVSLVGHTIIDEENKNNDFLTVKNCLLEGGKIGIYMGGTSYTALPKEVGGVVEGNTFRNNGTKALYLYDELGAKVRNNTVIIDADTETKISVGIFDISVHDEYTEATEITGNIFNVAPKTYAVAMDIRQMEGTAAAHAVIANNVVNMASLNSSYSPFKFDGTKIKYTDVAHNTFRMTGSTGGAAFWVSSKLADGYGNNTVVNNIIQNETDGYAFNLYNDANLSSDKFVFENNVMYTAGSTFFRAASSTTGDFDSFVNYFGATNCINAQVSFQSDDILMPANTLDGQLLTAQPLSYVTTDVTGAERPSTGITIGAYEFAADAVPVMAESYPKAASVTYESASVIVKADAMGKAFLLLKTQADEAPTVAEVAASEQNVTLTADTEAQFNLTELDAETTYVAYVVLQSAGGQNGTLSQVQFTTEAAPIVYPDPICMITDEDITPYEEDDEIIINQGENVSVYGLIGDGTAPFVAKWMNSKREVIAQKEFDDFDTAVSTLVKATVGNTGDYIFEVVDANDRVASATIRVIARGDLEVATFENLYTDPEDGFWMGDFSKGYMGSTFLSGSFSFDNMADTYGDIMYWGNFAYSQSTDNTFTGDITTEQFNAITGGGVDGSETFLVANSLYYGGTMNVLSNTAGAVIPGCYLTNSAYTVDAFLNGDGMSTEDGTSTGASTGSIGFRTGDWYKITIIADNGNQKEVYLADYTDADEDEHYYIDNWQWIDLSDLGTVKNLSFNYESSRNNAWGITTPAYFCMDNLGAECPAVEVHHTLMGNERTFSVTGAFDEPGNKGAVVYNIVETTPVTMSDKVSLSGDQLTFNGDEGEECEVFITCTQRGKVQYARFSITIDSCISTAINGTAPEAQSAAIYGVDGKVLTRGASQKGIRIIRQSDGTVRKVVK